MNSLLFNVVSVTYPILIYFIIVSINVLISRKYSRNIFIITMISSMYLILSYRDNNMLLLFSNIPILVCYLKKDYYLGIELSFFLIIFIIYNENIYITCIKLFLYFIVYLFLNKKSSFNYLFIEICGVIQGLFISFEYSFDFSNFISSYLLLLIVFGITFLIIFLFKKIDNITSMYEIINNMKKELDIKNSLFKLTHEVKNPIAVCKGYLDMINLNDYNSAYRYVDIIKNEINRCLNIMNDFMECSKVKINKEEFDLSMLIENVYESFKVLCKAKDIVINCDNNLEEIYVNGDYHRLEQVLVNVIKNSMEAIIGKGRINIKILLDNKYVTIKVIDNGVGMNEYELENVKEMFYTTKKDGTGLGVALSNEIMLLHNGSMEYESTKNNGTTCILKIPMEG